MGCLIRNSKAVGKVTATFAVVIAALFIALIVLSVLMSNKIDVLQKNNNSLQTQVSSLQTTNNQLQTNYNQLQNNYNNLYSQFNNFQNGIQQLESQLSSSTALIAQLQGPTGIMPTFMDLDWEGENVYSGGAYFLHLTLKNTGAVPITQIIITLNSVPITMTFTYLNSTVNSDTPLPSYQTAIGRQDVTSIVNSAKMTVPLVIQAITTNGTIYTYQTTITSHV